MGILGRLLAGEHGSTRRQSERLVRQGCDADDSGDPERALALFDRAIELDPEHAHAYRNRGVTYVRIGDLDAAEADLCRAIELEPDYALAWSSLGDVRVARDDIAGALDAFDRAVRLAPEEPTIRCCRADARLRAGDVSGARQDARLARRLAPDDPGGCYLGALAMAHAGHDAAAIVGYTLVLKRYPEHLLALSARLRALARIGAVDAALRDADRLIELTPGDPLPVVMRGAVELTMGRAEDAETDFERARSLAPDPAERTVVDEVIAEVRSEAATA